MKFIKFESEIARVSKIIFLGRKRCFLGLSKTFSSLFLVCGLVLRSVFENGVMVQIWRDGMSSPTAIQLVTVKTSRSLIGADRASLFKMNQWKCLTTFLILLHPNEAYQAVL